ncbi:MAG: FmdB family transcriptional regulator [Armatimonadetes bacterium]|nr:FmdB family transcriptional regulator [Armatimonadota bacterium]
MPTYAYECRTCGKNFEVDQRITEDALTDCDCGAENSLKRLIQKPLVIFNGPGFYVTDAGSSTTNSPDICTGEPASCPSCTPSE